MNACEGRTEVCFVFNCLKSHGPLSGQFFKHFGLTGEDIVAIEMIGYKVEWSALLNFGNCLFYDFPLFYWRSSPLYLWKFG